MQVTVEFITKHAHLLMIGNAVLFYFWVYNILDNFACMYEFHINSVHVKKNKKQRCNINISFYLIQFRFHFEYCEINCL